MSLFHRGAWAVAALAFVLRAAVVSGHLAKGGAVTRTTQILKGWSEADSITVLRSLIAGLSTTLGAFVVLLLPRSPPPSHVAFAFAFAAGVMTTVAVVELFAPQLRSLEHWLEDGLSAGSGVLAFLLLKRFVPEPEHSHVKSREDDESVQADETSGALSTLVQRRRWRSTVLLTVAITVHNFPEGMAVAVSSMKSNRLGLLLTVAIAMHNIPEGIAVAMPVLDATSSRWRAIVLATLSGIAEPVGAIVALTLVPDTLTRGRGMGMLLCFVGGMMICVSFAELLPEALALRMPISTGVGFVLGSAVMMITHELL